MNFGPPSSEQQRRFLASFLFGGNEEPGIAEVVRRAYLDLSRTVHAIDRSDSDGALRARAHRLVERLIGELFDAGPRAHATFDEWHRRSCTTISRHFARGSYESFYVGQAQKWINMAVKYGLTLTEIGWLEAKGARRLRSVAHAPLDSYFLEELPRVDARTDPPRLSTAWSRISDYDEYFAIQAWLRSEFVAAPLDVEFHLWQNASRRRRNARDSA